MKAKAIGTRMRSSALISRHTTRRLIRPPPASRAASICSVSRSGTPRTANLTAAIDARTVVLTKPIIEIA